MVSSRTEYYHGRIPGLTPCQPRPGGLSAPPAVPSRNSRGSDFEGSAGAEGERIFTAEIRTHFEQLPAKTSLIAALWRAVPRNRVTDRLSAPVRGLSTVTADSGFRVSALSCHVKSSVAMPWVPSPESLQVDWSTAQQDRQSGPRSWCSDLGRGRPMADDSRDYKVGRYRPRVKARRAPGRFR